MYVFFIIEEKTYWICTTYWVTFKITRLLIFWVSFIDAHDQRNNENSMHVRQVWQRWNLNAADLQSFCYHKDSQFPRSSKSRSVSVLVAWDKTRHGALTFLMAILAMYGSSKMPQFVRVPIPGIYTFILIFFCTFTCEISSLSLGKLHML